MSSCIETARFAPSPTSVGDPGPTMTRESHSGYNLTRHHLVKMGETHGFFARVVEAGFHQQAIRMVAEGEVDAAAIDSQVLVIELRDHSHLAEELRMLGAIGPATFQPVVAARRLPV